MNNLVWFQFGSFHDAAGAVVHGDIARFMAGDPTAGAFMSGFFPIMMFGLPAACFAMYRHAHTHRQKAVAGMLFSIALTAFLTGVTEPIEYSFMFLAPFLYLIHAILTGLSMVVMYFLGVKLGFTFSAGLIDYVLFFKMDTHPWLLIPVGIITALVYYVLFSFFIKRFNLQTIGREVEEEIDEDIKEIQEDSRAKAFVIALGGKANLDNVDACTTRLRLQVKNAYNIHKGMLKQLGAKGVVSPDDKTVQVILGPEADLISGEINDILPLINEADKAYHLEHTANKGASADSTHNQDEVNQAVSEDCVTQVLEALGGAVNIKTVELYALTRITLTLGELKKANLSVLESLVDGVLTVNDNVLQLIVLKNAEGFKTMLEKKIASL